MEVKMEETKVEYRAAWCNPDVMSPLSVKDYLSGSFETDHLGSIMNQN
jgi:hypothetical protein